MNFWLRRAEIKEMADELTDVFKGKMFSSAEQAMDYFNKKKEVVYRKHPKIRGELLIKVQIVEKIPGKQYWVSAVKIEDARK